MTLLIDTSVLVAVAVAHDTYHQEAVRLFRYLSSSEQRIVPAPVLSELFYFVARELDYQRAINSFARVETAFQIEELTSADMTRMREIMTRYADALFDFTDAAIMAQAERFNIKRIATFDRRHFPVFRPTHCEYLELLP